MSIFNLRQIFKYLSIGVLLFFIALSVAYAIKPSYLDHGEPGVTILALRFIQGLSVYQEPDAGQRIVLSYGPAVYLSQSLGVFLFSNPILGSKIIAVIITILALVVNFLVLRHRSDSLISLYASALFVCSLLWFEHFSFWNRPEPLILLSITLFLYSFIIKNPRFSLIFASISLSMLINSKIFAVIYIIPLLWLYFKQVEKYVFVKTGLLTIVFTGLPFLLYKQFPIDNYIYWLSIMGSHEFLGDILLNNIMNSLIMMIPSFVFFVGHLFQDNRPKNLIIAHLLIFVMFFCVSVIGSKAGAGSYYLLGCLPALFYVNVLSFESLRTTPLSISLSKVTNLCLKGIVGFWFIYLLMMVFTAQIDTFNYLLNPQYAKLDQDIRDIQARLGPSVQMGYGESKSYGATFVRPWLYKNGSEYLIDAMSYWDMQMAHLPTQEALLDQFRQRSSEYWLIPRSNQPFTMSLDLYSDDLAEVQPLFPDIAQVFTQNYQLVDHSLYFDIWQAKP